MGALSSLTAYFSRRFLTLTVGLPPKPNWSFQQEQSVLLSQVKKSNAGNVKQSVLLSPVNPSDTDQPLQSSLLSQIRTGEMGLLRVAGIDFSKRYLTKVKTRNFVTKFSFRWVRSEILMCLL